LPDYFHREPFGHRDACRSAAWPDGPRFPKPIESPSPAGAAHGSGLVSIRGGLPGQLAIQAVIGEVRRCLEFILLDHKDEWLAARVEDLDYGYVDGIVRNRRIARRQHARPAPACPAR
jgi:hypothetical protein